MAAPRWAEAYVGIARAERGASRDGCHCLGLVALVLREQAGIAINPYADLSADDLPGIFRAMARDGVLASWLPAMGTRRAFDVVTMLAPVVGRGGKERMIEGHVGIMLSESDVLHIDRGAGAAVAVPLTTLAPRLVATYRHVSLVTSGESRP